MGRFKLTEFHEEMLRAIAMYRFKNCEWPTLKEMVDDYYAGQYTEKQLLRSIRSLERKSLLFFEDQRLKLRVVKQVWSG